MLVSLKVKNLALIDETEIWLGDGLNILTGETGAGKSVIIGSIALALGQKADKEMIRTGAEYALAELIFQIKNPALRKQIADMELPIEEDGEVIISRRIMAARSVCKINGEAVSTKQVKELSELLLDIHGQHEHQSLLHKKKHFEILDEFAGEELENIKAEIKLHYEKYKKFKKENEENALDEESRKKELALAEFEAKEIEEAGLRTGEDEELEQSYRLMMNAKKIAEAVGRAYAMTAGTQGSGAGDLVGRALKEIRSVAEYDGKLAEYEEELTQIDNLLQDFSRETAGYLSNLEFDDRDFDRTEDRLNQINRLKDKYGNSLEKVLAYGREAEEKCSRLRDYEAYRIQAEENLREEEKLLQQWCEKASVCRKKYAKELSAQMEEALSDLNFLNTAFEIQVNAMPDRYSENGYDDVEFMISTNPGEPLKSLGSVASGGELSRIMLAIKTVLADKDNIETLIFDEIDAGISGKTAWKVSEKMAVLGRNHQIICITHLPQIAAMADEHFVIEKVMEEEHVRTDIRKLERKEQESELARLLGGADMTENTYKSACDLKEQAKRVKNDSNY